MPPRHRATPYSSAAVFSLPLQDYPVGVSQNLALIRARKACGLTQEKAAERLGVSQPTYQRWEAGTRHPRAANLKRIADLYGVSADSLLSDQDGDEAALVIATEEMGRIILTGAMRGLDRRQPLDIQVSAVWAALVGASRMMREDPSLSENRQAVQAAAAAVARTRRD